MERLFRSLKSEWLPPHGYKSLAAARADIEDYFMRYYNWRRPRGANEGMSPTVAEKLVNLVSRIALALYMLAFNQPRVHPLKSAVLMLPCWSVALYRVSGEKIIWCFRLFLSSLICHTELSMVGDRKPRSDS